MILNILVCIIDTDGMTAKIIYFKTEILNYYRVQTYVFGILIYLYLPNTLFVFEINSI